MIHTEPVSRDATRQLILEMKGGIIDDVDLKALESCTAFASHLWVGYINDRPVCSWGLVPPTLLSDKAYLWLYATPAVDDHKFMFVRHSQLVMEEMRTHYPSIYGVCEADNRRAIRWLKWLGAKFGPPFGAHIPFLIGNDNGPV